MSLEIGGSAYVCGGILFSISFSIDDNGNFAIQRSYANTFGYCDGVVIGGIGAGFSAGVKFTSLETVDDLNGYGTIDIQFSEGYSGFDLIVDWQGIEPEVVGGGVSCGVSMGSGVSASGAITKTLAKFNYKETFEEVKEFITNTVENVKETAQTVMDDVKTFAAETIETIQNVANDVKAFVDNAIDTVKNTFSNVASSILNFFGIKK